MTITVRGLSNKHCLLPFLVGIVSLRNMPMYYAMVFKGCKMIILDKNCDIFLILIKTQIVGTR